MFFECVVWIYLICGNISPGNKHYCKSLQRNQELMRNRNPQILKAVGKSIAQTGLVVIIFLVFFLINIQIFVVIFISLVRTVEIEIGWRKICQRIDLEEWGKFCKELLKRRPEFSLTGLITHYLVVFAILILIFQVCTELIFDFEKKSRVFRYWWRNVIVMIPPMLEQAAIGG